MEKSAAVVTVDEKKVNKILKSCTKKMTSGRRFHGGKVQNDKKVNVVYCRRQKSECKFIKAAQKKLNLGIKR